MVRQDTNQPVQEHHDHGFRNGLGQSGAGSAGAMDLPAVTQHQLCTSSTPALGQKEQGDAGPAGLGCLAQILLRLAFGEAIVNWAHTRGLPD